MERTIEKLQCWTKGRRSTAVVEDLRPTATVLFVVFLVFFSKMEAKCKLSCVFITQAPPVFRLDKFGFSLKIKTRPFLMSSLMEKSLNLD